MPAWPQTEFQEYRGLDHERRWGAGNSQAMDLSEAGICGPWERVWAYRELVLSMFSLVG